MKNVIKTLFLFGLISWGLSGQPYQTRFEQVRFDPAKGPATLHGPLDVEGATGAINMALPMGPGIGARGAQFTPTVFVRSSATGWSRTELVDPNYGLGVPPFLSHGPSGFMEVQAMFRVQSATETTYYSSGGSGNFTPGYLELQTFDSRNGTAISSYCLPTGASGVFGGTVPVGAQSPDDALGWFGRGSAQGWTIASLPYFTDINGSQVPVSFVQMGSGDELIVGLKKPGLAPEISIPDPSGTRTWVYPTCVLVIKGDTAYEYAFVGGVEDFAFIKYPRVANYPDGKWKQWLKSGRYLLSRVIGKYGDSVEFDYGFNYIGISTQNTIPNGLDYTARWHKKGQFTGVSVSLKFSGQTPLSAPQPAVGGLTASKAHSVQVSYSGGSQPPSFSLSYFSVDLVTETASTLPQLPTSWPTVSYIPEWGMYSSTCFPTQLKDLGNQESVDFDYKGAHFTEDLAGAWPILNSVRFSSGKQIALTWDHYPYRPNALANAWAGYVPDLSRWNAHAWGVTGIYESDVNSGQYRLTTHSRVTPVPVPNDYGWLSTKFYNAVTRTANETASTDTTSTTVSYYAEPTLDGNSSYQTLAHLTHKVVEQREYPGGGSVEERALPSSQSTAPIIEVFDRWDTRRVGNPTGSHLSIGSEIYPTRTRRWDQEIGVLEVQESSGWDNSAFLWKKKVTEKYRPGGTPDLLFDAYSQMIGIQRPVTYSNVQQVITTDRIGSFNPALWLGPMVTEESTAITDSTPGVVGGSTYTAPSVKRTYLTGTSLPQTITTGADGGIQTKVVLGYLGETTGNKSDMPFLESATVMDPTGIAPLSGNVGATYTYDDVYGYLSVIKPKGVLWDQKEERDALGRITKQTSPDGVVSRIEWDSSGRVTYLKAGTDLGTSYTYPTPMTVKAERSVQFSQYSYNSWGQLVMETRKSSSGANSYRIFSHDQAGRVTGATVWSSQGNLVDAGKGNLVSAKAYTVLEHGHGGPIILSQDPSVPQDSTTCSVCGEVLPVETRPALYTGTRTEYDWRGRVTRTIDPNGVTTVNGYGVWAQGLQVIRTLKSAEVQGSSVDLSTIYRYDAVGRLVQVVDPRGQQTSYRYDAAGRIASVQQYGTDLTIEQPARTWAYDSLGRQVQIFQPESGVTRYDQFDVTGKPWKTIYAHGSSDPRTVDQEYDSVGNLKSVASIGTTQVGGVDVQFTYDHGPNDGTPSRSKLVVASSGSVLRQLTYGGTNARLSSQSITVPGGISFTQGMTYDLDFGYLVSRTYPDGRVQTVQYDAAQGLPSGMGFTGMNGVTLTHDPVHWGLSSITVAGVASSFFNYGSDQARLTQMLHATGSGTLATWTYGYDGAGRLRTDGTDFYRMDELGRLQTAFVKDHPSAVSPTVGVMQSFGYDPYGNRTSLDSWKITNWTPGTVPPVSPESMGLVPLPGTRALSYQMTVAEKRSMAVANRLPETVGGVQTGVGADGYDVQGNLKRIQRVPGSTNEATDSLLTMGHDVLGRVIWMGDAGRNVVEVYTYDDQGLRVLVETYQGLVAPQILQKKQYRIYNEARQLISEYESVLE